MGPAHNSLHESFIMNFVFIMFLLLYTILLQVQLVTICDRLHFYKHFNVTFKKLYQVFQITYELYRVARQCHHLHVPKLRPKKTTRRLSQLLTETLLPIDECIQVLQSRSILIRHTESSPLLTPQRIPVLQQDRAMEEFDIETLSEPLMPIDDRSSDNDTQIHQVQPLLGTTHRENLQLQNRNRPENIADILGTNAFQGYVNTPLQTLNGIVVQQPKRFLPLAKEAKHLVEEIHIEKLNEQWAGIPHEQLLNQSF